MNKTTAGVRNTSSGNMVETVQQYWPKGFNVGHVQNECEAITATLLSVGIMSLKKSR